ncbi:MAG: hypothetical protein ACTHW1_06765 [Ancrocorticia sp.]|uniref:hypothetical protein n=1 Tax=Ancrocorticia sp. TaxID=2593684 RepID=UPI003F8F5B37
MSQNVMFSGGIPADGPEGVFELLSETIGDRALCWPDGETSPERRAWIGAINSEILAQSPCFEPVAATLSLPDDHPYHSFKTLKIRSGVEVNLRGQLPYAKDAIESYGVFKRMQAEGKIPDRTRFQVAVPGAHDVISISFPDSSEWPILFKAWEEALQEEYRRILEVIPSDELCIQIDYCTEMIHIGGTWQRDFDWVPDAPAEELFAYYTSEDYIQGHIAGLPDDVRLGIHVCCGTSPSFPVQSLDDISLPVRLSNAIQIAASGRIDYFHLPALTTSDEAYFAPLADLATGDATIYLGVECNDGIEAMDRRMKAARTFLPEFGVAHYCGYVWNKAIMSDLMRTLAAGADHQAAAAK